MNIKNVGTFKLAGRSHPCEIMIQVEPCDSDPFDQDFPSPEDRAELERKLSQGVLENVCIHVSVFFAGNFEGNDSLGGCIIGEGYTLDQCLTENGMIDNAIADLIRDIKEKASKLSALLTPETGGV